MKDEPIPVINSTKGVACVSQCQNCPIASKTKPPRWETRQTILNGWGNPHGDYLFVIEQPTSYDERYEEILSGSTGERLFKMLKDVGIPADDCFFTTAVRCTSPHVPVQKELDACKEFLAQDIRAVKPKVIIPMGNGPLWSVLAMKKISAQRGSIFDTEWGIPAVPTMSPASTFHSAGNIRVLLADLAKARQLVIGDRLPELGGYIYADSMETMDIIKKYLLTRDVIAFDCETTGLNSRAAGAKILCISFSSEPGEGFTVPFYGQHLRQLWSPEEEVFIENAVKEILEGPALKVAANGKFDLAWIEKHLSVYVNNYAFDTQYAYGVHHEEKPHGLEHQRTMFTNMPRYEAFKDWPEIKTLLKQYGGGYTGIPEHLLWPYAAADVDCAIRCYYANKGLLEQDSEGAKGAFYRKSKAERNAA